MRYHFVILLPLCLMIASGSAGAAGGRRLFKFVSKADFRPFQLANARWDDAAGGLVASPPPLRGRARAGGNLSDPQSPPPPCPLHPGEGGSTFPPPLRGRARVGGALLDPASSPSPLPPPSRGGGIECLDALVESPVVETGMPAKEIVVSWNALTPPGSHLHVYIHTRHGGFWSKRLTVAIWNRNNKPTQRTSLKQQKDMFGRMETDTLFLTVPADAFRVSARLSSSDGKTYPTLRMLAVSILSSNPRNAHIHTRKAAWGKDIPVPERSQLTIPDGNRFCSATSTAMVLDFWAQKLNRPELSAPLQTAVDGIYDRGWGGTGNWPFNTAYAAEFGGLRAYVTRLASLGELEMWIAQDLPVIVSIDYNRLRGRDTDQRMGHLMVLRGFTEEGDPIFNDPYTFLDKGESVRKVFERENFRKSWLTEVGSQGTVYLIYPDGWEIPKNKYGTW